MVQVLEGTSIALATNASEQIRKALALPANALTYLSSHGSLDVEHVSFFESLMNRIDDAVDRQAVTHVANVVYGLYRNVFLSLPRYEVAAQ
jgi:hypothetical protein